jgi:hypothetical protein
VSRIKSNIYFNLKTQFEFRKFPRSIKIFDGYNFQIPLERTLQTMPSAFSVASPVLAERGNAPLLPGHAVRNVAIAAALVMLAHALLVVTTWSSAPTPVAGHLDKTAETRQTAPIPLLTARLLPPRADPQPSSAPSSPPRSHEANHAAQQAKTGNAPPRRNSVASTKITAPARAETSPQKRLDKKPPVIPARPPLLPPSQGPQPSYPATAEGGDALSINEIHEQLARISREPPGIITGGSPSYAKPSFTPSSASASSDTDTTPPSAMAQALEKSARTDCRTAHSQHGLAALPFLLYDGLRGSGCRW